MQEGKPKRLAERTVDYGLAAMDYCDTLPRTAAGRHIGDQLLFASRLIPGDAVEALRTESRELMLMLGASINTVTARARQGGTIEA